jgi:hypothetical protein
MQGDADESNSTELERDVATFIKFWILSRPASPFSLGSLGNAKLSILDSCQ